MRPKSAGASPFTRSWKTTQHEKDPEKDPTQRYVVEEFTGPMSWKKHGTTATLVQAKRMAERIGGIVRARAARSNEVVCTWQEGRRSNG
jgi:hypothetical protein